MTKEEEQMKKRFIELAEKSYQNSQYVFTGFLNSNELSLFFECTFSFSHVPFQVFGGHEDCERKMVRFGGPELFGYEEEFPIVNLRIAPLQKKFSDEFTHRDFLGALMNLGILRSEIGDIFCKEKEGFVFVTKKMAPYIIENLTKIKHTHVTCQAVEQVTEELDVKKEELTYFASSERLDGLIAKVWNVSRSESILLFRERKVFVNERLWENNSSVLKKDDVVSVRGFGKFIYGGVNKTTQKGKLQIVIFKFV